MEGIFKLNGNLLHYLFRFLDYDIIITLVQSHLFKKVRGYLNFLEVFNFLKSHRFEKIVLKRYSQINNEPGLNYFSKYLARRFSLSASEIKENLYRYLDKKFPETMKISLDQMEINEFPEMINRYKSNVEVEIDLNYIVQENQMKLPENINGSIYIYQDIYFERDLYWYYTQRLMLRNVKIDYTDTEVRLINSALNALEEWYHKMPDSLETINLSLDWNELKSNIDKFFHIISYNINSIHSITIKDYAKDYQYPNNSEEFFLNIIRFLQRFDLNHVVEVIFSPWLCLSQNFARNLCTITKTPPHWIKIKSVFPMISSVEECKICSKLKLNQEDCFIDQQFLSFKVQLEELNYFTVIQVNLADATFKDYLKLNQFLKIQKQLKEISLCFTKNSVKRENLISIFNTISLSHIGILSVANLPERCFDLFLTIMKLNPLLSLNVSNDPINWIIKTGNHKPYLSINVKKITKDILSIIELFLVNNKCKPFLSIQIQNKGKYEKSANSCLWQQYPILIKNVEKIIWSCMAFSGQFLESLHFVNVKTVKLENIQYYDAKSMCNYIANFHNLEKLLLKGGKLLDEDLASILASIKSNKIQKISMTSGPISLKYIYNSLSSKFRFLSSLEVSTSSSNQEEEIQSLCHRIAELGQCFSLFNVNFTGNALL